MPDLLFQQLSTVQSDKQPVPFTLLSAATVAPLTFLSFITGTTSISNIVPPVSGAHMLLLVFTNAFPGPFLITGNIKSALQPIQFLPVLLVYDPITALYYGSVGTLT